ncbi:MAG: pilus assembly protein PilP [Halofilum sp. (in: g-proteobacteria)]
MTASRARPKAALLCAGALLLGGCAEDMSDLRQFVEEIKARPGGEVQPLPEFEEYEGFTYDETDLRNPFRPRADFSDGEDESSDEESSGLTPDRERRKEPLEQYPLDSLGMVGTLTQNGQRRGLVRDPDGVVHRVVPDNYLGQNHGRITAVEPDRIRIVEIVRDGQGGWMERDASLAMSNEE